MQPQPPGLLTALLPFPCPGCVLPGDFLTILESKGLRAAPPGLRLRAVLWAGHKLWVPGVHDAFLPLNADCHLYSGTMGPCEGCV